MNPATDIEAELKQLRQQLQDAHAEIDMLKRSRASEVSRVGALEESVTVAEQLLEAQRVGRLGSFNWDLTTQHVEWSDVIFEIFESDPSFDTTFENIFSRVFPEDQDRIMGLIHHAITTGETIEADYRILRLDGSEGVLFTRARVLRDADGRPVRLLGTAQDITERKRTESALQEANRQLEQQAETLRRRNDEVEAEVDRRTARLHEAHARLQAQTLENERERRFIERLITNLPGGVAYWDSNLVYQVVNPLYAKLVNNQPVESYVGRYLTDAVPGAIGETEAQFRRVLESGEPWKQVAYPFTVYREDGPHQTYYDFELHALKESDGTVSGLLAILFEATERVQLERAMSEQKLITEQLFADMPAGIAYLDENLVIRRVNPTYAQLTGIPPEQLVDRSMAEAFGAAAFEQVETLLRNVLDTGETYSATDFQFTYLVNGEPRESYWDFTYVPSWRDGRIQGLAILCTEVSHRLRIERLQAEQIEQLKAADRYKDEFLSVISHELRTPLNFIMGFASTLEDEVQGALNEKQHLAVSRILTGSERMLALVDDLLDFAKLQSGRFTMAPEPVSYPTVIREVVNLLQSLAEPKRIAIETAIDVPTPVVIDNRRISQVLVNLLNNAIKFTEAGGRVRITARLDGDRLLTEVADTGCGIDPDNIPRLFTHFTQLDMSSTRKAGGTGLGLAISKALIEAHGGRIWVESQPGVGSTFTFSLPMTAGAHEPR